MSRPRHIFSSTLGTHIIDFIASKRACGYKYRGEESLLRQLDKHLIAHKLKKIELSREIVEKWIERKDYESRRNQSARISIVKLFAGYLIARNIPAHIPVQFKTSRHSPEFIPYIFTRAQIASLFKSSDFEAVSRKQSRVASVFPVMVRLLYSTGIRLGEAKRLRWSDVNLAAGIISVFQGKFRKDRLIPLSDQMLKFMKTHREQEDGHFQDELVFPGRTGNEISANTIYGHYRNTLFNAGIPHGGRGKGPRLHDLRHTFAVHNLEKWLNAKQDLTVNMSILVDYLGHETMEGTQNYLRLVPTMYPEIVARADESVGKKVRRYENEKN